MQVQRTVEFLECQGGKDTRRSYDDNHVSIATWLEDSRERSRSVFVDICSCL